MPIREQKRQDARRYWLALATELRKCQHNLTLLETLVPDRDHPKIVENLETALLMQQVEKGVLDIVWAFAVDRGLSEKSLCPDAR